ncbi:unnamed protein product [marine sediment metagenome]|uniref:Uncharacterized protein n=1 Tax=marine sediment metagenome TaxID=412755 RepID=X1KT01_9ZZZZ
MQLASGPNDLRGLLLSRLHQVSSQLFKIDSMDSNFLSIAPETQPRQTPLGGLRRLGTVMNRRKSVVGPSAGTYDKKAEKKHFSPFAPFKRSDSSRDMQIPESPPGTPSDRPGTSMTEEEHARTLGVSHDRTLTDVVTPVPFSQPEPTGTNGTYQEAQARFAGNGAEHVDSEGFTERPSTIDEITRAQREAACVFHEDLT